MVPPVVPRGMHTPWSVGATARKRSTAPPSVPSQVLASLAGVDVPFRWRLSCDLLVLMDVMPVPTFNVLTYFPICVSCPWHGNDIASKGSSDTAVPPQRRPPSRGRMGLGASQERMAKGDAGGARPTACRLRPPHRVRLQPRADGSGERTRAVENRPGPMWSSRGTRSRCVKTGTTASLSRRRPAGARSILMTTTRAKARLRCRMSVRRDA